MAGELGIAPSQLSRVERGQRSVSDDFGKRLADYYGVRIDQVLGGFTVPEDIVRILRRHPEELDRLRRSYGNDPYAEGEG